MTCAIPPLDQTEVLIGRGYGLGYNRERTSRDQLHAGMDFVASTGSPVLAPVDGVVDFVSSNTGSRISADAARGGATGQVRQMGGYGNSVVLRHELAIPGLPNPFYTSYNHLSAVAPGIVPGARVTTGMLLGQVGNTTNGQFPGMGAHLHMELRRVPFPGSYARDTVDPNMLWSAVGIDWVGGRTEVERRVGGQLLIRADGPSGPTACPRTATGLAGASSRGWGPLVAASIPFGVPGVPFVGVRPSALDAYMNELPHFAYGLGTVPTGYVDPTRIKPTYARKGTTQMPREGSPAADVMPPDYTAATAAESPLAPVASAVGNSAVMIGAGIAGLIVIAGLMKGRK
jgi:hypothetical protein